MKVALATAWNPRGELARLVRLLPQLRQVYAHLAVSLPPDVDQQVVEALTGLEVVPAITPEWPWGRYLALQQALQGPSQVDYVHYVDFDRLLRWVETRPQEWRQTVTALQDCDCLVVGRTAEAYATHPQALRCTEQISNQVVSHLLGLPVDVSAGAKGFSRRAVKFLLAHTNPGRALGTDGEWPVLLQRAGFNIHYLEVDGLDWESADRYQEQAADAQRQQQAAMAYDADPQHWAQRVAVAEEITSAALDADHRSLSIAGPSFSD